MKLRTSLVSEKPKRIPRQSNWRDSAYARISYHPGVIINSTCNYKRL